MSGLRFVAVVAAFAVIVTGRPAQAAVSADVTIPFTDLGYRDGVTVAGVAPSVTFDLPHYRTLQTATLHLELHAAAAAASSSTVSVAVDGRSVFHRTLAEIGHDARLVVPLPLAAGPAQTLAITVSGALHAAGAACAGDASRSLFLRVGRDSALVVHSIAGGGADAFFRDYRDAVDIAGADDDPDVVAAPYRIDRLEPWHRVDATLVAAPHAGGRTLVLARGERTNRVGDVLRIDPATFAALPLPQGEAPPRHEGSLSFADLHQHLGSATGAGDVAFDVPLPGSIVGGVPRGLRVHAVVAHSGVPAGASGTLQVLVNGSLVGARMLDAQAGTQTIDVAVPASIVGTSNDVRVLLATHDPSAACGTGAPITATLLDRSAFFWSGVDRRPASIESFLTALNGRVIVLVAPGFTRAAFHFMVDLGKMNAAITQLDVAPYAGRIPSGYDAAIVFAAPDAFGTLRLPVRPHEAAFTVVNPISGATVLHAEAATSFDLLQLGDANGTPVLAVTYHGDPQALRSLESLGPEALATQVAGVTVVAADGATAYDIGEKLRVTYADDETLAMVWARVRLVVALCLLLAIAGAGIYAARRLTGRTNP